MLAFNYGFWETWINPQNVTFDPENKLIWINSGITQIDVGIDLYSNWKEWVLTYDNAKWTSAFYTFGGDPTGGSQSAPAYFFLTNGWKVYVKNQNIIVQTNLYSDDEKSPFIIDGAAVTNRNSDSPVVRSTIDQIIAYNDKVYVDTSSIYIGFEYPVGTIYEPVNNVTDAILIANKYNITKLYIKSDLILTNDYDLTGFDLYGDKNNIIVTSIVTNIGLLDDTRFHNMNIRGSFASADTSLIDCIILSDITNINGEIKTSEIRARIQVDNNLVLNSCYASLGGDNPALILDLNSGVTASASVRAFSGGVEIINCDTPTDRVVVELIAGRIQLNNTCTAGTIDIRGVGYLVDNSSGCTVVTTGLVSNYTNILTDIDGNVIILTGMTQTVLDNISGSTDEIMNGINEINLDLIPIASGITQIQNDIIDINSGITNIDNDIINIITSMDSLTTTVSELDDKVNFISGSTYEMNQNVLIMTSGFTDINSGFTEIEESISEMTDVVNLLDNKVSYISGTTYEMNQNVINMTDNVSDMTDAVNIMSNEVNDMFIAVNNLDAQIKRILGLVQENFRIVDHVYNSDNTLASATIKIYPTDGDCDADTNAIATYNMTALYDSSSRLVNYKVTKN
jgi:uncharacterized protein YoxC